MRTVRLLLRLFLLLAGAAGFAGLVLPFIKRRILNIGNAAGSKCDSHCVGMQGIIVTNEFHQYRAGIITKELGLSYGAVPAKTAPWLFPTYYAREFFGVLYEWIF